MKNDKICINKSVMFIAAVLVILMGVVMATNYVNNQKLSTKSRADFDRDGGAVTLTPGATFVMSSFKLSELKTRAQEILRIKSSQLDASAMQKMQSTLSTAQTSAESTFNDIKKQSGTLGDLVTAKKTTLGDDLLAATNKVTAKEALLATANTNTKLAQDDRDSDEKNLQKKQKELDDKIAAAVPAKNAVEAQRKIMDNTVTALLNSNTSSDPNNDDTLNGLRVAKDITDTDKYIEALRDLESNVSNTVIFSDTEKFRFSPSLEALITSQATYKSFEVTPVELSAANGAISALKTSLEQSEQKLVEAKTEENKIAMELLDEQNKEGVVKQMIGSVTSFENTLKTFSGALSETSVLPGQLSKLALPSPDYGVGTTAISEINSGVDKVNGALLTASNAYDAFDKAIGGGKDEVRTQVEGLKGYCAKVDGYPLLDANGLPAKVAEDFYKDPPPAGGGCAANENDPVWNGYFGSKSKCYTATGMCSLTENPTDTGTIIGRDTGKACIYREVGMNKCLAKFPGSLKQQFETNNSLVCTGGKYFQIDGEYYQTGAEEAFDGSNYKYCVNKRVDPKDSVAIAAANTGIAQGLTDQIAKQTEICNKNGTFQSMPNSEKVTYLMSPLYGEPAQKVVVSHVCYQVGGMSSPNGSYCMNRLLPESGLCQCAKAGKKITFDGLKYNCEYLN